MSAEDRTKELRQKKKEARQSGGPEKIAARRRQRTGSARERVERLCDADSFVELDVFVAGVVTGHGLVAGRDVYVFSLDPEAPEGSLGAEYVKKLTKVMDLALTNGAPLVGVYDGAAVEEAAPLGADSGLLLRKVLGSGVVPQIAAVVGPVGGAAAFAPALADVVVMVKGRGRLLPAARSESGGP
jgi:acetyl-CoA carboxylase carboxyltransferase component